MQKDITYLMGLDVYTDKGIKIGTIEDVVLDTDGGRIKHLALTDVINEFRDPSKRGILVPFRWVLSIGEIVIVKWPIDMDAYKKNTENPEKEEMEIGQVNERTA